MANLSTQSVEQLLQRGACVNEVDGSGLTPLHHAVKSGLLDAVRFLLENGSDVNATEIPSGRSPVFYASTRGMVELLLTWAADINHRDIKGRTALHKAAEDGLVEVAQTLIRKGADVNDRDFESWTPLHYAACRHGNADMVGMLLFYGADSGIVNRFGVTPCDMTTSQNYRPFVPPLAPTVRVN